MEVESVARCAKENAHNAAHTCKTFFEKMADIPWLPYVIVAVVLLWVASLFWKHRDKS